MKNIIALLSALLIVCGCGLTAFAAGVDDGTLSVATKDGQKYFGTSISEYLVKYTAADGSGDEFYDLTGDKSMNICDLVALVNDETDLDQNGTYDAADSAALRLLILADKEN